MFADHKSIEILYKPFSKCGKVKAKTKYVKQVYKEMVNFMCQEIINTPWYLSKHKLIFPFCAKYVEHVNLLVTA